LTDLSSLCQETEERKIRIFEYQMMPPLSKTFSREVRGEDVDVGGNTHNPRISLPPNPSDVKINVEGAFIIDDDTPPTYSEARNGTAGEGVYFENKDIRLPHHTAVVSHVAVDVRKSPLCPSCLLFFILLTCKSADTLTNRSEVPWPRWSIFLENPSPRMVEAG
jgi:hypothetical protein